MLDMKTMDKRDCEVYGGLIGLIAGLVLAGLLRGALPGIFLVILMIGAAAGGVAYARKTCGKAADAGAAPAPKKAAAAKPSPKAAAKAKPKAAPAPEPASSPAAPAAAAKPAFLSAARAGGADDLKLIKGVGPKLERTLNDLGVYHYDQIAGWTPAEVAWVDDHLKFRGRIERDGWIDQARTLAAGGTTEFSKRAAGSGAPSSQG